MGGNSYEQLGAAKAWHDQTTDPGRMQTTKESRDQMFFKVPTLRNVDQTGPYFHDGHVKTLEEAVRLMAKHEAGTDLSDADVHSIVTFLHTLTGDLPAQYIQPPAQMTAATAPASKSSAISFNGNHRVGASSGSVQGGA